MICRLCLSNINEEISVPVFEDNNRLADKGAAYMISKYLFLEFSPDDNVSTLICQDCFNHLEDFNRFFTLIEQKQKTLQNQQKAPEFFEVKCVESDNEFNKDNTDVVISTIKEELLELEIDPVCDNSNESFLAEETETSSNDMWHLEKIRKKAKLKSKIKNENPVDAQIKFHPTEIETTSENFELNCGICNEHTGNINELKRHFLSKHKGQRAFIKCCGRKLTQSESITNHFKRHGSSKKFNCPFCDKALCSEMKLNIHMNSMHNEDRKSFKCEICQKEFKSKGSCKSHMLRHKREKAQINCDKCKRSFSSLMRLKRHCQIMHESVYPYKCQACDEKFLSKKDKETHQTICKNRSVLENDQRARKNLSTEFICKICCKIFVNSNRLNKHIAFVHENVHPYVCDQCGKKFKFKPTFDNHMLQHAGVVDPPAQCNICGKWLKHKNSLRLHLYAHDNSVNKCELCDHEAPTRTALRHHVKKVHRLEREHQCKYCDKSFKDPKSQEEHIATHTGAQLYSCPHCSKETRSSSNMYAHVKRMHPEEWLKAKLARSYDPNAKIQLEVLAS